MGLKYALERLKYVSFLSSEGGGRKKRNVSSGANNKKKSYKKYKTCKKGSNKN